MSCKSRLPKPSGLPVPKSQFLGVKSNTLALSIPVLQRLPLTSDLVNLTKYPGQKVNRAASPDLDAMKTALSNAAVNKSKMRRSRSACDLREHINKPLKRLEHTLAPINSRLTSKSSSMSTIAGKNGKPLILMANFILRHLFFVKCIRTSHLSMRC